MICCAASLSDVGRTRTNNEDNYLQLDNFRLYAVADGLGGHAAGEHASRIAIETLAIHRTLKSDPEAAFVAAFAKAHENIIDSIRRHPERAGMGTTLSAMTIRGGMAYFAHVGDSRIYRRRDNVTEQITKDQVVYGHVLANALGVMQKSYSGAQIERRTCKDGDIFVICSDGFSNYITDDGLNEMLKVYRDYGKLSATEISRKLIHHALQAGGVDNITVIVIICE